MVGGCSRLCVGRVLHYLMSLSHEWEVGVTLRIKMGNWEPEKLTCLSKVLYSLWVVQSSTQISQLGTSSLHYLLSPTKDWLLWTPKPCHMSPPHFLLELTGQPHFIGSWCFHTVQGILPAASNLSVPLPYSVSNGKKNKSYLVNFYDNETETGKFA